MMIVLITGKNGARRYHWAPSNQLEKSFLTILSYKPNFVFPDKSGSTSLS